MSDAGSYQMLPTTEAIVTIARLTAERDDAIGRLNVLAERFGEVTAERDRLREAGAMVVEYHGADAGLFRISVERLAAALKETEHD